MAQRTPLRHAAPKAIVKAGIKPRISLLFNDSHHIAFQIGQIYVVHGAGRCHVGFPLLQIHLLGDHSLAHFPCALVTFSMVRDMFCEQIGELVDNRPRSRTPSFNQAEWEERRMLPAECS